MTDKEFRRMSRGDLIEIIYQYQHKEKELTEEIATLTASIEDRRIKIDKAGSIAEAVLSLNNVFESAQATADQYLAEIYVAKVSAETENRRMLDEAQKEADTILVQAQSQCDTMLKQAEQECHAMKKKAEEDCSIIYTKVTDLLKSHEELRTLLSDQKIMP